MIQAIIQRWNPTYRKRPIFRIHVPRSGVSYQEELEWRLAAVWANYKLDEFLELDGYTQSEVIATYRCHNQIEAVVAYEQSKAARPKGRK